VTRFNNLPSARPSHHWGKVVNPPKVNKPRFNQGPPGSAALAPVVPGSLADVMQQLGQLLQTTVPSSRQLYLPDVYPIPTAIEFEFAGTVATVGANVQTFIPGTLFDLPAGYIGLIHTFNISVLSVMTLATNQQFSILINGAPAQGYAGRTFAGRAAQNFERSFDCALRIPNGGIVSIVNTNVDGAAYTVGADVTGWYMSVADVTRWLNGQGQLSGT
jgi:hypothetical protein